MAEEESKEEHIEVDDKPSQLSTSKVAATGGKVEEEPSKSNPIASSEAQKPPVLEDEHSDSSVKPMTVAE